MACEFRKESDTDTKKSLAVLFPITVVLLSVAVILIVTTKLIVSHWQPDKEVPHQVFWDSDARPNSGDGQVINLTPKRDHFFDETKVIFASEMNPNRDPMAYFTVEGQSGCRILHDGDSSQPQVYVGPSLDEDCFPLHNAELI